MKQLNVKRWMAGIVAALTSLAAQAGTVTYFHNDLAGSPQSATNASGQVIWRESYRPYGERLTHSASARDNKLWFTSRRQDADTGLIYMGARYYDPTIGRFVSMDPVGFDEQNLHTHNRYAYGNNNPYRYKDPDGRLPALVVPLLPLIPPAVAKLSAAVAGLATGGVVGYGLWNEVIATQGDPAAQDSASGAGEKPASTPTGRRGSPMDVEAGTNAPANIGGRDYTGHALDRMQGRGVPPAAVEDAIRNGKTTSGNQQGTRVHQGDSGVTVVTGDDGRVITVIPR